MGITAKSKAKSSNENWGMGLLLVFFPEENSAAAVTSTTTTPTAIVDKVNNSPFSSSNLNTNSKTIKRTNSNNPILTKTQSTISICALLLFLTLLLFTLSTFEPTTAIKTPRRFLSDNNNSNKSQINKFNNHHTSNTGKSWFFKIWSNNRPRNGTKFQFVSTSALQGMGKLYCRGTRAMNDLVVAHVVEDTNEDEFKLFLRLLLRSGLFAKADVVFIFGSSSSSSRFDGLIKQETDSFLKLVHYYKELNSTSRDSVSASLRFDVTHFVKHGKKEMGEPLWGKRTRVNNFNESEESGSQLTRLSYGSVVGFEANELDPENSLAGFLDHVPMSLKRWACYPMLLGRVRRNFKHIMLVDVKALVLLNDPLGRVRNQSPELVYISTKQETSSSSKHSKRNMDKSQSHTQVNSAILMGGARGIRRLSSAMLTEIARVAMQHKARKNLVTESAILSQLVSNGHILKNIELMTSSEPISEPSSVSGSNSFWLVNYKIIQRGNANHDLNSIIMKHVCSCEVDSSVYRDC
ncbi:hypothetical protein JCGZ_21096 [Jatropha curcas]|uniref:DUF7780 domain-containing protein n=1 Tax=Jatropha curcas TaxID=180498 RepID=A0A067JTA4_JATCU|nr:uncharacterized protein LOC105645238 [Jatropha curcas]KDP26063.1 hypothetical protein JCGZ_21096 [Jatropha curcas]